LELKPRGAATTGKIIKEKGSSKQQAIESRLQRNEINWTEYFTEFA